MKKLITLALALMLIVALAAPALAADTTIDQASDPKTASTALTYEVATKYTVTIPESVTITNGTGSGQVSVAGSIIPFDQGLNVAITAAENYDEDNTLFRLRDGANENYISYTIDKDGVPADPIAMGGAFLTVPAGTAAGSATLTYTAEAPTIAGTYSDNLTFTVSVASLHP